LGDREAEAPPTSITTENPAKLKADLPEASQTKEGLLAWLIRAFDVLNTPDLVALLVPLKDDVAALGEEAQNHADRRVRRRLRELLKRVASASAEAAAPKEAEAPVVAEAED